MASNKMHIGIVAYASVDQLVEHVFLQDKQVILCIERISTVVTFGFGGQLATEPVTQL